MDNLRQTPAAPPPDPGGEGVRVRRKPRGRAWPMETRLALAAVAVAGVVILAAALAPAAPPSAEAVPPSGAGTPVAAHRGHDARADARGQALPPSWASEARPGNEPRAADPNDLASWFRPGDPEPSGANVIRALHEAGIRTGIGAFPPPGTSPPLEGLAVPEDFVLPEGYVRHHQTSDDGKPIEPILMFSPDIALHDAQGRPVAIPANRVVPPELAPPGLPLRRVRPGTP